MIGRNPPLAQCGERAACLASSYRPSAATDTDHDVLALGQRLVHHVGDGLRGSWRCPVSQSVVLKPLLQRLVSGHRVEHRSPGQRQLPPPLRPPPPPHTPSSQPRCPPAGRPVSHHHCRLLLGHDHQHSVAAAAGWAVLRPSWPTSGPVLILDSLRCAALPSRCLLHADYSLPSAGLPGSAAVLHRRSVRRQRSGGGQPHAPLDYSTTINSWLVSNAQLQVDLRISNSEPDLDFVQLQYSDRHGKRRWTRPTCLDALGADNGVADLCSALKSQTSAL